MEELLNWLSKHNVIHDYAIDPEDKMVAICLREGENFHQFPIELTVVPPELLNSIDTIAAETIDHERKWMAEGLRNIYGAQ